MLLRIAFELNGIEVYSSQNSEYKYLKEYGRDAR